MPTLIKLDMEFSLIIELKLAIIDTGYFIGLIPIENSQTQIGKVPRWTHTGDEARHMMNYK